MKDLMVLAQNIAKVGNLCKSFFCQGYRPLENVVLALKVT